jgi:formate-dependent nitrite reductase cytochrome c552 subunit
MDRDNLYKKEIASLKKDVTNMREKMKLLEKRLDFTQDENTKLAVEVQAVVQGVQHIVGIALKIAEREKVSADMGLDNNDEEKPTRPVKEGLYG